MLEFSPEQTIGTDTQLRPGQPTDLPLFTRPVEALRKTPRRAARITGSE